MGDDHEDSFRYRSELTPPDFCGADTVEDPNLIFMLAHWLELKGDRKMPSREEITARAIGHRLRHIHIYEVLKEGGYRARLVGSGVFLGMKEEQTGKLISEHPDPGVRFRFGMCLDRVTQTAMPLRSLSVRLTGSMIHDQYTEVLWLPLSKSDDVEQVLAVSSLATVTPGTSAFGGASGKTKTERND
jgi:hypothetical protein